MYSLCIFNFQQAKLYFYLIHILLTVQHGYSIIIQCSESFTLEKLYFRLNDICEVLQLYDPAQGLQHSACFFSCDKNYPIIIQCSESFSLENYTLD